MGVNLIREFESHPLRHSPRLQRYFGNELTVVFASSLCPLLLPPVSPPRARAPEDDRNLSRTRQRPGTGGGTDVAAVAQPPDRRGAGRGHGTVGTPGGGPPGRASLARH